MKLLPFPQPIALVDLETTGGSPAQSRIIEIAIIRIEPETKPLAYQSLINPHQPIPYFIQRMTTITPDLVKNAPSFSDISQTVLKLLKGALFIAHNASFDYSFLTQEFERAGHRYESKLLCSAKLSKRLYPEYRRHNLSEIIERHGLSIENRHRAMGDTLAVLDFLAIAARDKGEDIFMQNVDSLLATKKAARKYQTPKNQI